MNEPAVTVVVSRRVTPGADADFERWVQRMRSAAERFPGHLGSEAQPPADAHPGEWVVVYRFQSKGELDAWLQSDQRQSLLDQGQSMVVGEPTEQIVVEPAGDTNPVTVVMSQRVNPDRHTEFALAHAGVVAELQSFDGFLRCDLAEPVAGVQDEHVILFSFDSRQHLDTWLISEPRRRWVASIEPFLEGNRTMNVVGGFAGWFPHSADGESKRWKQATVVLLALFPMSLLISAARARIAPGLPPVVSVLLSNIIGIGALTWWLMPWLTRRLAPWLRR